MKSTRKAYGEALVEIGREDKDVVVLDADLAHATQTLLFKNKFPDRHINVGIAEQDFGNGKLFCFRSNRLLSGVERLAQSSGRDEKRNLQ